MADCERWPPQRAIQPSEASTAELKATKELFKVAVDEADKLYEVLDKFELRKALNICAWITWFVHNSRLSDQKLRGPLTTEELQKQHLFWVKRAQQSCELEDDRLRLKLQPNPHGVLECRGRIQVLYPLYLPDKHLYTKKCIVNTCAPYTGE